MAINIPSSVFNVYYDVCDWLLSDPHTSYECIITYPPIREVCEACIINPPTGGSTNVYSHGGPAPFNLGMCPLCGGNGYKEVSSSSTIRLRVFWAKKDWIKIANSVNIQDATAQVIGKISDLSAVLKATEISVTEPESNCVWKMTLAAEPFAWGFGKYFVAYLRRV